MKKIIFFLCAACGFCLSLNARIELPEIIGSGMVLQQQCEVPLWGKAKANFIVKIKPSWSTLTYSVKSDNKGAWRILIKTPAAGGPFTITITDDQKLELKDVLIGEVWLCSGQSNMEMPMKGFSNQPILNANDILADAANSNLRLFHVQRSVSVKPEYNCTGMWQVSSPETASEFSAVGFQFAKRLQEILKVPVGIIQAAWGGTPIEAWMNKESIELFHTRKIDLPAPDSTADRLKPTCLFNGMINPVAGYGIKGILWYQGETNVGAYREYAELMRLMVNGWRKLWKNDDLYFYYVQIAPWRYGARKDAAPYFREAQYDAMSKIPNSGMVVSIDKGSATTIHPADKTAISKRLLYWALANAYQVKGIAYQSPYFDKMTIKNDKASLQFLNAPNGFYCPENDIVGFEIAGEDKKFYPAKAKVLKGGIVEVSGADVKAPVAVRYAFKDMVNGNLYSIEDLPVAPFRTDNW